MLVGSSVLCVKCKGSRRLCGRPVCPILVRFQSEVRSALMVKDRYVFGSTPPSLIVGERGYPTVSVMPGIPLTVGEEAKFYDDPESWWGRVSLLDVVRLRASTIYPKLRLNVQAPSRAGSSALYELQWAIASTRPVDTEARLAKPIRPTLRFDGVVKPVGPSAPAERIRVAGNPSVPRPIEVLASDEDVRASIAVVELYERGVSVYDIIRVFSAGLLGLRARRRLVPTRWAITAVDSIIGDYLVSRVRDLNALGEIRLYHVDYLGNHFEVLLLPGCYSFELIEAWLPRSVWLRSSSEPVIVSNHERWDGVPVEEADGGYYAVRTGVLEGLLKLRRQATVLVIREIRPDYYVPIGNWHIRESVRRAFNMRPEKPSSMEEALQAIAGRLKTSIGDVIRASTLVKAYRYQARLTRYL